MPFRWLRKAAMSVEPLPTKGSRMVLPTKLNSFMQRCGSLIGKAAGYPPAPFLLCPAKVHTPLVQSINSCLVISFSLRPLFFLYKTK